MTGGLSQYRRKRDFAAMAVLTVHHWPDKAAGVREVRRVTRGQVVLLTFDPSRRPWLTDYLPELAALDEGQMSASGGAAPVSVVSCR